MKPIVRSFDSERDARAWGEKEERQLKRARMFSPVLGLAEQDAPGSETTLGTVIERYLEEVTPRPLRSRSRISPLRWSFIISTQDNIRAKRKA
jgi:hypothetical protein